MKGFWYTMEAVFACIVIGIFLVVIAKGNFGATTEIQGNSIAYDILEELDDRGVLRDYAAAMNYSGLDDEVYSGSYQHSINICDYSRSCFGPAVNASNVLVGSYLIAGSYQYDPLEVKLFLWK